MKSLVSLVRRSGKVAAASLGTSSEWHGGDGFQLEHSGLGMSRVVGRIIAGQDYTAIMTERRRNYFHLTARLAKIAPPIFGALPDGVCPWVYAFETSDKDRVVERFRDRGVDVDFWQIFHPALPAGSFPESDRLRRTVVRLPCHQDLTVENLDWLADLVQQTMEGLR